MSSLKTRAEFTEPERYELDEGPSYHFEISRRNFVQVVGAGLLISVAARPVLAQRSGAGGNQSANLAERLHIGADGQITLFTSKVEVGQGSRTQLTQAAAEELRAPVNRIRLIMADTAQGPNDGGTAGSRTTPATVPAIRKACAAARQLLIDTAASAFQVDAKDLTVQDAKVEGLGSGRQFSYADLASEKHAAVLKRQIAPDVNVTKVSQWRVLGASLPRVDASAIVTGAHQYPSDIIRPGMLYGKVLRPPSYGARLTEIDLASANAKADVTALRDGDFVGFAAPSSLAAEQARDEAGKTAKWTTAENPSSDELYAYLRAHSLSQRPRRDIKGSPDDAFKNASKVLRESCHIAYIQHAPMEPRAAFAEWTDGNLTVWTGSQQPARVREELARSLRVPSERVRVIIPDTGGGFGGEEASCGALDARRGIHLGLLSPRRGHRRRRRTGFKRRVGHLGTCQFLVWGVRDRHAIPNSQHSHRIQIMPIAVACRLVSGVGLDGQCLRPRIDDG